MLRTKSIPLFSLLAALLATTLLCGCHKSEAHWTNGYFHSEANVRRICDNLKGTYDISAMRVLRCDKAGTTVVYKDSALQAMLPDPTAKLQYIVGGYGDQHITIPNFPISLIAPCLKDTALARAIAAVPNQNLVCSYTLSAEIGTDDDEAKGVIHFDVQPISLSLNFNGRQRIVEIDFDSDVSLGIDGEDPETQNVFSLQLSLDDVEVKGGDKQDFDGGWDNDPSFNIIAHGERSGK